MGYRTNFFDKAAAGVLLILTLLGHPSAVLGADKLNHDLKTLTIYLENDIFAGEDQNYTNGLKLTWSSPIYKAYPPKAWPHRWLYPVIKKLPFESSERTRNNITYSLGQNIYTPADIEEEDLIENDRPYAGITYGSIGFHNRTLTDMDTLELYLGIVGPQSYAEQSQETIHALFNDKEPKGWDNQLDNEPVIGIVYSHKKKLVESRGSKNFGYDWILNTGGGIGNAMTFYNLGLTFRIGWNMPNDFGNFPIRPASAFNGAFDDSDPRMQEGKNLGLHLFFAVNGKAVIRDIFLDGNTFSDSHSVDKKPLVADYITGLGFIMGKVKLSMAYVIRTESFEAQADPQKFGSINMSFSY